MAFKLWKYPSRKGRKNFLYYLEVGEYWVLEHKSVKDISRHVKYYQKKHGVEFSYLECKNGVVVRRDK